MAGEGDTAVFVFEGRSRTNSLRTPDEFEAQLSRILPLKGQNPPGALCLPLLKSYRLLDERPSGFYSLLLRRKMSTVSPSPGRFRGTNDSVRVIGPVRRPSRRRPHLLKSSLHVRKQPIFDGLYDIMTEKADKRSTLRCGPCSGRMHFLRRTPA